MRRMRVIATRAIGCGAAFSGSSRQSRRAQITSLRDRQLALRHTINDEVQHLLPQFAAERHGLIMIDEASAQELLGAMIMWAGAPRPTRPRLERAVLAIKTARPGSRHVVGDGVYLQFGPRQFTVEVVQ